MMTDPVFDQVQRVDKYGRRAGAIINKNVDLKKFYRLEEDSNEGIEEKEFYDVEDHEKMMESEVESDEEVNVSEFENDAVSDGLESDFEDVLGTEI